MVTDKPNNKTKVCRKCGKRKPIAKFWKCKDFKQGIKACCKDCTNAAKSEYRSRDPEKWRQIGRAYIRRLRDEIIAAYGGKCNCPGCEEYRYEFLALDHVNGDGKAHRLELGGSTAVYEDVRRKNYPPEYRILCHNCNQSRGYYGFCPHEVEQACSVSTVEESLLLNYEDVESPLEQLLYSSN